MGTLAAGGACGAGGVKDYCRAGHLGASLCLGRLHSPQHACADHRHVTPPPIFCVYCSHIVVIARRAHGGLASAQ